MRISITLPQGTFELYRSFEFIYQKVFRLTVKWRQVLSYKYESFTRSSIVRGNTDTNIQRTIWQYQNEMVQRSFRITVSEPAGFRNMKENYFITADFFGMSSVRTIHTHSFADSRFLFTYAIRILIAWLCVDNSSCVTHTSSNQMEFSSAVKNCCA